jgi:hypothetical protein
MVKDLNMPAFNDPAFARFAQSLDPAIEAEDGDAFALLVDGIPIHVAFLAESNEVGIVLFAGDASFVGTARPLLVDALLLLGCASLRGRPFSCGLDSRGLVALHAQKPLAALDPAAFGEWLAYLLGQAKSIRKLIDACAGLELAV